MPDTVTVEIAPEERGERLDRVLAQRLPELSRSRLKALILEGHVRLDGTPVNDRAEQRALVEAACGTFVAVTLPRLAALGIVVPRPEPAT